jgi:hypothetical protein
MNKSAISTSIFLVIYFAFSLTSSAQTSRGTITGIITDQNGAVVQGANILLTNTATKTERSTTTNEEGLFRFDAVDLGDYSLKASASGFGTVTKTNIIINANNISQIDFQLSPTGVDTTVNVSADAASQLQLETPLRGGNIDDVEIRELPFSSRNPVSLALTIPGVSTNRYGSGVATFVVNGARQRSNNFLIDGTENNDISVAGQGFQITNPDAVEEVSIQTSNYDAEFGRAGGAVVNVVTKSGTNNFHGTLSYLLDVTRDDAITNTQLRLDPQVRRRGHPLPGTEQWFSGTIGGPLYLPKFGEGGDPLYKGKNRTFFFFALQEQRQRSQSQSKVNTLSASGRATLRSIFPSGTNPRVDTLLSITNGIDATEDLSNQDLGLGRLPIQFGAAIVSYPQTLTNRQVQARIDHYISERDQLSVRYLWAKSDQPTGGATGFTFPDLTTSSQQYYQNLLFAETHVFSPEVTNELRLAYNRINLSSPLDPKNPLGRTLPLYAIAGLSVSTTTGTNYGVNPAFPQGRIANNYVLQDTMTYLRGKHTFRFGFDLLKQRSRQFAPISDRGILTYGNSTVGTTFTGFANFVDDFGGSGGAVRDFGSAAYYPELFRQAYFFQDRWRATVGLTLTLGIRYENFGTPFNSLRTPAFTGLFNIDPVTFTGPYNQPNRIPGDNNNFSPVIGIAYSPSFEEGLLGYIFGDRRSVIRTGYRIGYDSFYNNIASNASVASPNLISTNTTSTPSATAPRGLPNLSSLLPSVPRALTPLDAQNNLIAPNLVNPYYQRWSFGIQRELPGKLLLDLAYVGSKGTKLYLTEDLNPTVPPIFRITPAGYTGPRCDLAPQIPAGCRLSGRLDNLQGSRNIRTNGGSSIYHAGQLDLYRRFSNGFSTRVGYTWSKLIDNGSDVFNIGQTNSTANSAIPPAFGGAGLERAVSLFDRTHRLSIAYVYELPFMKEQRGIVGRILGGFGISGITTFESGVPLNVVNGADADGIGGNLDRPDFNPNGRPGVRARPDSSSPTGYINRDDNNAPIDPRTARYIGIANIPGVIRTGNAGRNTERTPGTNTWNLNLLKNIELSESTRLELRTEFYNLFNHPQPGQGSVSPFSPGNQGISASVFTSNAGQFLNPTIPDAGGRVIRYQLKLVF